MKCPKCGSMQSRRPSCRRCGNPIESVAAENPYAPPVAPSLGLAVPGGAAEIFRRGEILVARDGTLFPDRCVRCNLAADGFRVRKTFSWHSSSWYLLVFLNLIIYAIVAMVVRKKASFELALCPKHRSRRQWSFAIGFGLPIVAFMVMMATEGSYLAFWGFLLALFVGALVGIIGTQILTCKKIDDEYAYLKGAHPQFLSNLPGI